MSPRNWLAVGKSRFWLVFFSYSPSFSISESFPWLFLHESLLFYHLIVHRDSQNIIHAGLCATLSISLGQGWDEALDYELGIVDFIRWREGHSLKEKKALLWEEGNRDPRQAINRKSKQNQTSLPLYTWCHLHLIFYKHLQNILGHVSLIDNKYMVNNKYGGNFLSLKIIGRLNFILLFLIIFHCSGLLNSHTVIYPFFSIQPNKIIQSQNNQNNTDTHLPATSNTEFVVCIQAMINLSIRAFKDRELPFMNDFFLTRKGEGEVRWHLA